MYVFQEIAKFTILYLLLTFQVALIPSPIVKAFTRSVDVMACPSSSCEALTLGSTTVSIKTCGAYLVTRLTSKTNTTVTEAGHLITLFNFIAATLLSTVIAIETIGTS